MAENTQNLFQSSGRHVQSAIPNAQQPFSFDGPAYSPNRDQARLAGQILRIYDLMKDGRWRTVAEISRVTGDPETSISAQLRHLRKPRFGLHTVERRYEGNGLHAFRLIVRQP